MKPIVTYLRVSTDQQADHGFGLDVQREQIASYCQLHDLEVTEEYQDVTSGSTGLDERVGLAGALEALALERGEAIVVARYDRLARDLVQQEMILREVTATNGEVISAASGEANLSDDDSDPSRKLIRQILGAVSEYERELIVARMKRGRMAKAARGGFATGSPPYGWKSDHQGGLIEDPVEQHGLELLLTMRDAGLTYQHIADQMNHRKIPPKRGLGYRWHRNPVRRIIERMDEPEFRRMVGLDDREA